MALSTRELLRQIGPSEIYARYVAPDLLGDVHGLHEYRAPHNRNVLLFHASMGQPEVHEFIMSRGEPVVLVYHNITPPEYYEPYDVAFADLLALGRREVQLL